MQLKPEQLGAHLQQNLHPVYLVAGDEPLQVMEAAEQIRQSAYAQGFVERDVLTVDAQFNWQVLLEASRALSLFAEKKVLDLRMASAKPGQHGSRALQGYLQQAPGDKVLLIQSGRLDKSTRQSAWVKAIEKCGVLVNVWDLSSAQTLAWVSRRMKQAGLQANTDAVRYLSDSVEGNLLAAQQEIHKLKLLFGSTPLEVKHIAATVMDNSRFSVFDFSDAILQQDTKRVRHILQILKAEDTPLPLIVWALADVMRQGHDYTRTGNAGRVTPMRRDLLQRHAQRLRTLPWGGLFARLALLEKHSKGVGEDVQRSGQRLWDEVERLALACCGIQLPLA